MIEVETLVMRSAKLYLPALRNGREQRVDHGGAVRIPVEGTVRSAEGEVVAHIIPLTPCAEEARLNRVDHVFVVRELAGHV